MTLVKTFHRRWKPYTLQYGIYKGACFLLIRAISKQEIFHTALTNKITYLPQSKPSTNKHIRLNLNLNKNKTHHISPPQTLKSNSPPTTTMSDALIFEYLSASRPSKRGSSHASHNDHSATLSSSTPANNRSDIRASVSGKGRDGKRGSLDWIRGVGKKA